jgi:hypothetical protein
VSEMKALVICPGGRKAVANLARRRPLALAPFLGQPVLGHALGFLAAAGAKEILVLADDRPDEVRKFAGRGEAWGAKVEIVPETRELTAAEARAKYQTGATGWMPAPNDIYLLDRLPQLPGHPLWESYTGWRAAALAWLPQAAPGKVGMRELSPGVFIGLRARVNESATLNPPCWIGANVWVGPHAIIGPETIIEDNVYVDEGAEVARSVVGPKTYVGALTEVRNSLAWGRDLLNLESGSVTEITDHFLLGELGLARRSKPAGLAGRLAALAALVVTSPVALAGWARARASGRPFVVRKIASRGGMAAATPTGDTLAYYELAGFSGKWRRWPELWSIARGQFAWVGNRPITPGQAAQLATEFDQLWLAAPTGIFSLADAQGCAEEFGDEARAHASFYAVDPARWKNWRIFWRMIRIGFQPKSG